MPTANPKFTTEIWSDFKVERHEDYTVIWPMRFYPKEDKDNADKTGLLVWCLCAIRFILRIIIVILCLSIILK